MKVFVIGAGQMGSGIAQVSAQAGYDTYIFRGIPLYCLIWAECSSRERK